MNSVESGFKIEIKHGKADKIHIYANGEYTATVDAVYWFSSGAAACEVLDEEELEILLSSIERRRAYNKALDLLSLRDHSQKELYDKLKMRFSREAAESAVEQAREAGFLDDEAYAHKLCAELFRRKKFGPERIKSELIFRGISREAAQNAVEGLDIDDEACIIELLNTKYSGSLSDEKCVRRTFNSLMRMGYRAYDIKKALRAHVREDDEY